MLNLVIHPSKATQCPSWQGRLRSSKGWHDVDRSGAASTELGLNWVDLDLISINFDQGC